MNKTPNCLEQMRFPEPGTFPYYIGNYLFPILFTTGVVGNVLNFIVLNKMRSKSVHFLSAMVVADLFFFLSMFMVNLNVYDSLATSSAFLNFYSTSKMTVVTLANWFSSASIWFVIMVTVERLVAIRTPLWARTIWTHHRVAFVIVLICVSTLLLNLPHFFWLKPIRFADCSNPNQTTVVLLQINNNHPYYMFLKYANVVCPILVVTIPLILMISLNSLLIHHVRLSRRHIKELGGLMNQSDQTNDEKELKLTWMVLIIVFTFFIVNFPSAVVFMYSIFETNQIRLSKLITPSIVTNYMVTLGKALNFPLYCCSSSNFRKQLRKIFRQIVDSEMWRKLSLTDTTTIISSFVMKKMSRQISNESNGTNMIVLHVDNVRKVNKNETKRLDRDNSVILDKDSCTS